MDTHDAGVLNVSTDRAPDIEWQRIWLSMRQRGWSSLAIIGSEAGLDVHSVSEMLVATGQVHGEKPVSTLNAQGIRLSDVHQLVDAMQDKTTAGEWIIVPVDPIAENPNAIPVLQAASAVVLVVQLGESLLDSARKVIEVAGRDRVLGSIVLTRQTGEQQSPARRGA
jgi:hypothetical protein